MLESLENKSTECNFQLLNNGNYGTSPLCFHRSSECSFTAIKAKWMSERKEGEATGVCTWKLMDSSCEGNYVLKRLTLLAVSIFSCISISGGMKSNRSILPSFNIESLMIPAWIRMRRRSFRLRNPRSLASNLPLRASLPGRKIFCAIWRKKHKLNINVDQWCILILNLCSKRLFHKQKLGKMYTVWKENLLGKWFVFPTTAIQPSSYPQKSFNLKPISSLLHRHSIHQS